MVSRIAVPLCGAADAEELIQADAEDCASKKLARSTGIRLQQALLPAVRL